MSSSESSLTAPADRDPEKRWRPEQHKPPLTEDELDHAVQALVNTDFVEKFPRVDRTYADPPIPLQTYTLISFMPSKGATPDKDGIYGMAKIRGSYATETEALQRSEFLVKNVDSYHTIFHGYVGRPFPLTNSSKYSAEVSEVDIRKAITETVSSSVKDKKLEEKRAMEELQEREKELLDQSNKAKADPGFGDPDVDPYDEYITQAVKKAQLSWTFMEHLKKMIEVRESIIHCRKVLAELDEAHPDFREKYMEKYMAARRSAGLDKEDAEKVQQNFIQYMVEDFAIPTIDTEEVLPVVPGHSADSQTYLKRKPK